MHPVLLALCSARWFNEEPYLDETPFRADLVLTECYPTPRLRPLGLE